jgi:putative restriction endonuclease
MIDGCHIIPFSKNYNDTIINGIALCPNLHKAFDRALITTDEIIAFLYQKGSTVTVSGFLKINKSFCHPGQILSSH